jgi:hypothetical protein
MYYNKTQIDQRTDILAEQLLVSQGFSSTVLKLTLYEGKINEEWQNSKIK